MYGRIKDMRSVRKLYTELLVRRGELTKEQDEAALDEFQKILVGR
jgi:2-oxoglutarate dehydrogenase E1 component